MSTNLAELMSWMEKNEPDYVDLITATTEDEFDAALIPLLQKTVDHMESNSKNFRNLDETGLSAAFKGSLEGFGLLVTQETNSNGHVDVTITGYLGSPQQKRLGEAKLYNGYAYHIKGLEQLLGYMTGRAGGYILNYVRKKDIAQLVRNLRQEMDNGRPSRQSSACSDYRLKWSFCSHHNHTSGEQIKITHIGFNMFAD